MNGIIQFALELMKETLLGTFRNLWIIVISIIIARILVKNVPLWIKHYHDNNIKEIALQRAVGMGK